MDPMPAAVPEDPFAGLAQASTAKMRDEVTSCDPAYYTEGTWLLVHDAITRPASWMRMMLARVPEHCKGAMGPHDPRPTPLYEEHLARAAAGAPREGARVELACVFEHRATWEPFDPTQVDPKHLRARFVDPSGEFVGDASANNLKRALAALGNDVSFSQAGPRDPLVLWREGLVAGILMGFGGWEHAEAPIARIVSGRPAPHRALPDGWKPPLGQGLHDSRDTPGKGLGPGVVKWARWLGGVEAPPEFGAPMGAWLAPTRAGPMLLWAVDGAPAAVGARYAFPRRALALTEGLRYPSELLGAPSLVSGEVLVPMSAAYEYEHLWEALGLLALPPDARPDPAALAAEARSHLPPILPPARPGVLDPGTRPVFVAVQALDAERRPLGGRWQVLDRQRWVRLRGHAPRRVIERHVARLNASARMP